MATSDDPNILILSGGSGASGEQVIHTVLAQFPETKVKVTTLPNILDRAQIDEAVNQASAENAIMVHTLVDEALNRYLISKADEQGIFHVDLMQELMSELSKRLGVQPLGRPGMYRKLRQAYFDRVAAIEYTMNHDDGKDPEGWPDAEIILTGVSRVGKTPLSLFLSVQGWKVANIPLVPDIDLNPAFYQLDTRRIIGLTMQPGQLIYHRQHRQERMGAPGLSPYSDPQVIQEEVRTYNQFMQKTGITMIDVTDMPIETSADEVLKILARQIGKGWKRH
jgi:hypothetical protein